MYEGIYCSERHNDVKCHNLVMDTHWPLVMVLC